MTMPAWVGDRARPPADLDWVVRPTAATGLDTRAPYPFLDRIDPVQYWPEATQGAGRAQPWTYQDEDTRRRPGAAAPGGSALDARRGAGARGAAACGGHAAAGAAPEDPGGVTLDVANAQPDRDWDYAGFRLDYGGSAGARVHVPWRVGALSGIVQLDFAFDEPLPEPPVLTAVPRGAGVSRPRRGRRAGSCRCCGSCSGSPRTRPVRAPPGARTSTTRSCSPSLPASPCPPACAASCRPSTWPKIRSMTVDWSSHPVHDPESWLDRLAWAVQHHFVDGVRP